MNFRFKTVATAVVAMLCATSSYGQFNEEIRYSNNQSFTSGRYQNPGSYSNQWNSIEWTYDGLVFTAGSIRESNTNSNQNVLLNAFEPNGQVVLSHQIGDSPVRDFGHALKRASNGKFVAVAGGTRDTPTGSQDGLVLLRNPGASVTLWSAHYPQVSNWTAIERAPANSFGGGVSYPDGFIVAGVDGAEIVVARIREANGQIEWTRRISPFGMQTNEYLRPEGILLTQGGGFIVYGNYEYQFPDQSKGNVFTIQMDGAGNSGNFKVYDVHGQQDYGIEVTEDPNSPGDFYAVFNTLNADPNLAQTWGDQMFTVMRLDAGLNPMWFKSYWEFDDIKDFVKAVDIDVTYDHQLRIATNCYFSPTQNMHIGFLSADMNANLMDHKLYFGQTFFQEDQVALDMVRVKEDYAIHGKGINNGPNRNAVIWVDKNGEGGNNCFNILDLKHTQVNGDTETIPPVVSNPGNTWGTNAMAAPWLNGNEFPCGGSVGSFLPVAGVEEMSLTNARIYPTMLEENQMITLEVDAKASGSYDLIVTNVLGAVVYQSAVDLNEGENVREIQLSGLSGGVHFVKLNKADRSILTQKVIVR